MITYHPILKSLNTDLLNTRDLSVDVLRLDLLHPEVSGNKWFKLKRNFEKAKKQNLKTIITFGGAYSNHIAATAAACKVYGFHAIGVIKGDELPSLNPTLLKAKENGMVLLFVGRELYGQKESADFKKYLGEKFGVHYLIPEGGNNTEGVLGCTEILDTTRNYDYIFCAVGTGTTFAGLVMSSNPCQVVVGISVLKGQNRLPTETKLLLDKISPKNNFEIYGNEEIQKPVIENNCIINNFAFNGYAKYDRALVEFKKTFEIQFEIPLDHVYTAKLFYAVVTLAKQFKIKKGATILIIHSGGLQGNEGFEEQFRIQKTSFRTDTNY